MTQMSSRRAAFRSETAEPHAALERVVGAIETAPSYARYLKGLHAFRAPVEAAFDGFDWSGFGDWRPTQIAQALAQDLADLGLDPVPSRHVPVIADRDSAFGVLYVLEGSSLGAKLIYRDALRLGLSKENGARHLEIQATGVETWRGYLALLDADQQLDLPRAVLAANAAFEAARLSFANVGPHVT
jgi:heme oxygenase (biliverdin-IX-beta and delta-forming)